VRGEHTRFNADFVISNVFGQGAEEPSGDGFGFDQVLQNTIVSKHGAPRTAT
jgi:hypothetical protein